MKKLILFCAMLFLSTPALSQDDYSQLPDGTYDATVTTKSGSYGVPVEVQGGEVGVVHWPNGGNMHVYGADIDSSGDASGSNSKGDYVQIEIQK